MIIYSKTAYNREKGDGIIFIGNSLTCTTGIKGGSYFHHPLHPVAFNSFRMGKAWKKHVIACSISTLLQDEKNKVLYLFWIACYSLSSWLWACKISCLNDKIISSAKKKSISQKSAKKTRHASSYTFFSFFWHNQRHKKVTPVCYLVFFASSAKLLLTTRNTRRWRTTWKKGTVVILKLEHDEHQQK